MCSGRFLLLFFTLRDHSIPAVPITPRVLLWKLSTCGNPAGQVLIIFAGVECSSLPRVHILVILTDPGTCYERLENNWRKLRDP